MLTDYVVLQQLKAGTLNDTESVIANIPRRTHQSLVLVVTMSAAQAASLQLLVKADPPGAGPLAAVAGLRLGYKLLMAGVKTGGGKVVTDVNGMVAVPLTDSSTLEVTLPPMFSSRNDAIQVGVKTAAAPTGTLTYVALLAGSRA